MSARERIGCGLGRTTCPVFFARSSAGTLPPRHRSLPLRPGAAVATVAADAAVGYIDGEEVPDVLCAACVFYAQYRLPSPTKYIFSLKNTELYATHSAEIAQVNFHKRSSENSRNS